ncbi:hypothetical protein JKA74_12585 [Marivirga sp. S37H4]|uniref:Bacteriocin n=1 Tax=Marivirga aurantiaca TaxID=2802615 RepID=A0A935CC98_9BACT|nr:hypothetical protein [Marivirga aurantiaca]MBK6265873.1 hypothetical protein [Marivirga aurantiaca]
MKKVNLETLEQINGGLVMDPGLTTCNILWGLAMTASDSISRETYVGAYVSAGCVS